MKKAYKKYIDEKGRITIPKEIREEFEIYTDFSVIVRTGTTARGKRIIVIEVE